MVSDCHFIGVINSCTDPGKEKELKPPAATKDKGNMAGQICIQLLISMHIKKYWNALTLCFLKYDLVRNL